MAFGSFFNELKRRNVYKVAVAYAVVAWLLIQAASILLPTFEAPSWVMKAFVVFIALGFILALGVSWAFEATPEGLKRTADVPPEDAVKLPSWSARKFTMFVLVVAIIAIGLLAFQLRNRTATQNGGAATAVSEKSIAVLPFENLSDDKSNAYFASGIQDEILTRLAKIGELKVISRTSTAQYQSKPGNLSDVAKQLGVAHVLEGSVQKAGDAVRVNVQLINAHTDSHVWAETYDRKLTDMFAVETEIARTVADQLQAQLTGHEQHALAVKPTTNPEAYDEYLRGLAAEAEQLHSAYAGFDAAKHYARAVQLDPNFALAWAKLAHVDSELYGTPDDPTPARHDAAKHALDMAQQLQPNAPETLLALADYQSLALRDYPAAEATYREVAKLSPGNSDVPFQLARLARRQGRLDEAAQLQEQALALDPRNTPLLVSAALSCGDLRKFDRAHAFCDRALAITPNDLDVKAAKAGLYQGEGDVAKAATLLASVDALTSSIPVVATKIQQLWYERNFAAAIALLQARFAQFHFGSDLEKGVFGVLLSASQQFAGDAVGARQSAEQARDLLAALTRDQPENTFAAFWLSRAYALLGDKAAAYAEAQRAATARGYSSHKAASDENLAVLDATLGDSARAITTLTRLLQTPYVSTYYSTPITPALLRLDPTWDPLRNDPAFQKLGQPSL